MTFPNRRMHRVAAIATAVEVTGVRAMCSITACLQVAVNGQSAQLSIQTNTN
jgi:hypothetical protein